MFNNFSAMVLFTLVMHNWTLDGLQPVAAWNWWGPLANDSQEDSRLPLHTETLGGNGVKGLASPSQGSLEYLALWPWLSVRGLVSTPDDEELPRALAEQAESGDSRNANSTDIPKRLRAGSPGATTSRPWFFWARNYYWIKPESSVME